MTKDNNFIFRDDSKIAVVSKGYCWQYIFPTAYDDSDNYLCSLKKIGDYVFVGEHVTSSYREGIQAGLDGCELEWLKFDELSDSKKLKFLV